MMLSLQDLQKRVDAKHGQKAIKLLAFNGWKENSEFKCLTCKHEWPARLGNVTHNSGCPVCAKSRQAKNISLGHANSSLRAKKYYEFITDMERLFNITCLERRVPEKHDIKLQFQCNVCEHTWDKALLRLQSIKHGCPECAEVERIAASRTPESRALRSKLFTKSTEYMRARTLRNSDGRTRLVSEWLGRNEPRTFECTICEEQWEVSGKNNTNGASTNLLCMECTPGGGFSSIAIAWLEQEAKRRKIKIRHALNGGEYIIPGTKMRVDGYHAATKTVFEFHGDAFHGNLERYGRRDRPHPFSTKCTATLNRRTRKREETIKAMGYNLVVIWESDFRDSLRGAK